MSNRRKPRVHSSLNGDTPALPLPLQRMEWSDDPPARYDNQVLEWIATQAREAGRLNVWRCEECDTSVLCYDRHPGVTPFMVAHRTLGGDCDGITRSCFYSRDAVLQYAPSFHGHTDLEPTHEWYRPSVEELRRCSRPVRDHVMQGGLLVREVAS